MIVISAFIVVLVFVLVKYKGTVCSPFTLLCVALVLVVCQAHCVVVVL